MARIAKVTRFTPTLDTAAYAAGDQMSTLQTVPFLDPLFGAELTHLTLLDRALQKDPIDLFFFSRSVTVASDNAAASFSDADMEFCLGVVNVLAADFDDNAANSIASVAINPNMTLRADNRGRDVFIALVQRGDGDYDASSIVVSLHGSVDDGA